jgi:hypothetical protein
MFGGYPPAFLKTKIILSKNARWVFTSLFGDEKDSLINAWWVTNSLLRTKMIL